MRCLWTWLLIGLLFCAFLSVFALGYHVLADYSYWAIMDDLVPVYHLNWFVIVPYVLIWPSLKKGETISLHDRKSSLTKNERELEKYQGNVLKYLIVGVLAVALIALSMCITFAFAYFAFRRDIGIGFIDYVKEQMSLVFWVYATLGAPGWAFVFMRGISLQVFFQQNRG